MSVSVCVCVHPRNKGESDTQTAEQQGEWRMFPVKLGGSGEMVH